MLTHSPGCLLILEIFQNSDIRKQFFSLEKSGFAAPKHTAIGISGIRSRCGGVTLPK